MTPRKYSCEICYIRSIGKVDYEAHIRGIKHRVEVKRLIQNERSHWKHDRVPQGTHYTCMICEEATYDSASASSYQDHLLAEHPRPTSEAAQMETAGSWKPFTPVKCGFCNAFLVNRHNYEAHITGKQHMCEVKQEIQNEKRWATIGSRPTQPVGYQCLLCCTTYEDAERYYEHLISKHPSRHSVDTAPYLGRTSKESTMRHGSSGIVCQVCRIVFPQKSEYWEHKRSPYHVTAVKYLQQREKHSVLKEEQSDAKSRVPEKFRRRNAYQDDPCSHLQSGYKCSLCGAFHRSQYLLDAHIFSQHHEMTYSNIRK